MARPGWRESQGLLPFHWKAFNAEGGGTGTTANGAAVGKTMNPVAALPAPMFNKKLRGHITGGAFSRLNRSMCVITLWTEL